MTHLVPLGEPFDPNDTPAVRRIRSLTGLSRFSITHKHGVGQPADTVPLYILIDLGAQPVNRRPVIRQALADAGLYPFMPTPATLLLVASDVCPEPPADQEQAPPTAGTLLREYLDEALHAVTPVKVDELADKDRRVATDLAFGCFVRGGTIDDLAAELEAWWLGEYGDVPAPTDRKGVSWPT